MTLDDLSQFPSLNRAYVESTGLPGLGDSYLATTLFPGYPDFHDIQTVDSALGILLPRFSVEDLSAQIRDVFGPTESNWNVALTELLAFSRLQQDEQLECIGWPHLDTDTPPFEGRLFDVNAADQPIAFDVKNARNAGLRLLEEALSPVVTAWRSTNSLPQVQIEFDTTGPVTQELLGPNNRRMATDFKGLLSSFKTFPKGPIKLTQGGTTILVKVRAYTGMAMNTGITSVLDRARSVHNIVRSHVLKKAFQADKHGGHFVIIYVRPPNSGDADVKPRDLKQLLPNLDTDPQLTKEPGIDRWLGVVMLDWTANPTAPHRYGLLRGSADWPGQSSPDTLAETLALSPWP